MDIPFESHGEYKSLPSKHVVGTPEIVALRTVRGITLSRKGNFIVYIRQTEMHDECCSSRCRDRKTQRDGAGNHGEMQIVLMLAEETDAAG